MDEKVPSPGCPLLMVSSSTCCDFVHCCVFGMKKKWRMIQQLIFCVPSVGSLSPVKQCAAFLFLISSWLLCSKMFLMFHWPSRILAFRFWIHELSRRRAWWENVSLATRVCFHVTGELILQFEPSTPAHPIAINLNSCESQRSDNSV